MSKLQICFVPSLAFLMAISQASFGAESAKGICVEILASPKNGPEIMGKVTWHEVLGGVAVRLSIYAKGGQACATDNFEMTYNNMDDLFQAYSLTPKSREKYFNHFFTFNSSLNGCSWEKIEAREVPESPELIQHDKRRRVKAGIIEKALVGHRCIVIYYRRSWREELIKLAYVESLDGFVQLLSDYDAD